MRRVTFQHAKLENGEEISIRKAVSGGKGYFCIGCNSPMMACIGLVQTPHFRHQADVGAAKECVWSDETYRHKVAKDILQITKSIKVPSVLIPLPAEYGEDEEVEIRGARTVQADRVLIERYVYLDEAGNVRLTKDASPVENLISVKPDALFLDAQDNIILLIEICATHKVDAEKLAKLMTIGIDTVEVRIPPVPEKEDIEKILKSHTNTQWLYNYERVHTIFDPSTHLPKRKSPGAALGRGYVHSGEGFQCRAFRIKNVIRQLETYLGSGDFGRRKSEVEDAIRQVSGAGVEAGKRFLRMDDAARAAAEENIRQRDRLDDEAKRRHRNVEQRYRKASSELEGEEEAVAGSERELSAIFKEEVRPTAEKLSGEESELRARIGAEEDSIAKRVEAARVRVDELRAEIESIGDEETHLEREEKLYRAAEYYLSCQIESERQIDSGMREEISRVNGEANKIGEDLCRIRRVREKYLGLEGKVDTDRQNQ